MGPYTLLFDIETVGLPLESLDEAQQEFWLRPAQRELTEEAQASKRQDLIQQLNLSPLTAQVVAIAMVNVDSWRGKVLYQAEDAEEWTSDDGLVEFVSGTEEELLMGFWEAITRFDRFVTFNGRGFDCPFLMLRSAVLGIKPTRDLMPYRFDPRKHCDLADQLTFYGAFAQRRFNLDFYCKAFGIESPKAEGITGLDVNRLFAEKQFRQIAEYCLRDVRATVHLYRMWRELLSFE
jgi:predicted PolB exonuclease-like 3'-5' exonuclease